MPFPQKWSLSRYLINLLTIHTETIASLIEASQFEFANISNGFAKPGIRCSKYFGSLYFLTFSYFIDSDTDGHSIQCII